MAGARQLPRLRTVDRIIDQAGLVAVQLQTWWQQLAERAENPSLPVFTVATLPSPSTEGRMIQVSDESGGAVPAFADGTNWRRVTDRAVVS